MSDAENDILTMVERLVGICEHQKDRLDACVVAIDVLFQTVAHLQSELKILKQLR